MGLADTKPGKKGISKTAVEKKFQPANAVAEVKTDIDLIYEYVVEQKSAPLSLISKRLNAPLENVEEFSRIFDKQGLLELHFPLVGEPILRVRAVALLKKR